MKINKGDTVRTIYGKTASVARTYGNFADVYITYGGFERMETYHVTKLFVNGVAGLPVE